MNLSCSCDEDYDWYYELPEDEYSACSTSKCYGCGKAVLIGDTVRKIWSHELDEDGEEINDHVIGRICQECSGLYDSLRELGFCLTADNGFIKEAMADYRDMLPPQHIMRPKN